MRASRYVILSGRAVFSPLSLLPDGFYVSDPSGLFAEDEGTGTVAADGAVGYRTDLSVSGNHLINATANARPLYKTSGGLHWLEADGSNDFLAVSTAIAGKELYVAAAVRPISTGDFNRFLSINAVAGNDFDGTNRGCIVLRLGVGTWGALVNQVTLGTDDDVDDGTDYVVESIFTDGQHVFSVDGVDSAPVVSAHDFDAVTMRLFGAAQGGDFINARDYGLFWRIGAPPSSAERAQLRTYLAAKQGRVL